MSSGSVVAPTPSLLGSEVDNGFLHPCAFAYCWHLVQVQCLSFLLLRFESFPACSAALVLLVSSAAFPYSCQWIANWLLFWQMREVLYGCLEARNVLLLHSCLPATGDRAWRSLQRSASLPALLLSRSSCVTFSLCFKATSGWSCHPKETSPELSGSHPWQDRHLRGSNRKEAFSSLFVSCLLKPSLEEELSAVLPWERVCLRAHQALCLWS